MKQLISNEILVCVHFSSQSCAMAGLDSFFAHPPKGFRPAQIGIYENPRAEGIRPISADAVKQTLSRSPTGFVLFGDRKTWKADVTLSSAANLSHIDFWIPSRSALYNAASSLFDMCDAHAAIYGYAAHFEEFKARHQLSINLGATHALTWCGRDFQKYIPGLYWMNYFSDSYRAQMSIHVDTMAQIAGAGHIRHQHGDTFQMYADPCSWLAHAQEVSEEASCLDNVFSIAHVAAPGHVAYAELHDVLHRLGTEWP